MKLVTSYPNADLDGVSSAYSYAEYLNKNGKNAVAGIFGEKHIEAEKALEITGATIEDGKELFEETEKIVLVDDSRLGGLPEPIDPANVVEVIDHREITEEEIFPNATTNIEKVGAAATLIAERFIENNTEISDKSAILLYGGIASNTLNWNAKVTTDRDIEARDWLARKSDIPKDFVRKLFEEKSEIEDVSEALWGDVKTVSIDGKSLGIFQLEIIDAERFMEEHQGKIEDELDRLLEENDMAYLTVADLEDGFNFILSTDEETREIISEALGIDFQNGKARTDEVLLRKQINPKLRSQYEG